MSLLQFVAEKTEYALSKGLKVILCVGETLEQRESNQTFDVISKQVKPVASKVKDWSNIVVAYEPVWAIGTGKVASKEQASTCAVHHHLVPPNLTPPHPTPQVLLSSPSTVHHSLVPTRCSGLAFLDEVYLPVTTQHESQSCMVLPCFKCRLRCCPEVYPMKQIVSE